MQLQVMYEMYSACTCCSARTPVRCCRASGVVYWHANGKWSDI